MIRHDRPSPGRGTILAVLAAALTVPSVISAIQLYVGYGFRGIPVAFGAPLVIQLVHWEWWVLAGPLVWSLERRWPLSGPRRRSSLLRHAIAAPLVASGVLALNLVAYHIVVRLPGVKGWFLGFDKSIAVTTVIYFVSYFHVELIVYAVVVAVAHASRTSAMLRAREHEALRLEAELTGARLTALRTQLQPHFLFNTLHTVGSLVLQRENERAVQLLAELGELLRETLRHRDTDLTPLEDEIAYLRRYLRIEEARFGDRLTVEWDLDPHAASALVPPFILQPLVENAFRHGISRRADDAVLRISAVRDDGCVRVTIYNDGPPLPPSFSLPHSAGYGLQNVTARLRTRQPAGSLTLHDVNGGVQAELVVPLWSAVREETV